METKRNHFWINHSIFLQTQNRPFWPKIDLFASRLNNQLPRYVAWQPDPGAEAVDAFTLDWHSDKFFAFPPFSLLGRVIQKIEDDQAEGILVAPNWPKQIWYPNLIRLLVHKPLMLPKGKHLLKLPYNPKQIHPLRSKLVLLACHLSGNPSVKKVFESKPFKSSRHPGKTPPKNNKLDVCKTGKGSAVEGKLICFHHLCDHCVISFENWVPLQNCLLRTWPARSQWFWCCYRVEGSKQSKKIQLLDLKGKHTKPGRHLQDLKFKAYARGYWSSRHQPTRHQEVTSPPTNSPPSEVTSPPSKIYSPPNLII